MREPECPQRRRACCSRSAPPRHAPVDSPCGRDPAQRPPPELPSQPETTSCCWPRRRSTGRSASGCSVVVPWRPSTSWLGPETKCPWTAPTRQVVLPIVKPGGVKKVQVAGSGPIPDEAVRMAMLTVSAPNGALVSLGGHPAVDTRGGAVTMPASLDKQGKVTVRVAGGKATLSVTGWSMDAAGEEVSFVPAAGTVLLGPADVVATSGSSITVDRAAPGVPVGGHVLGPPQEWGGVLPRRGLGIREPLRRRHPAPARSRHCGSCVHRLRRELPRSRRCAAAT